MNTINIFGKPCKINEKKYLVKWDIKKASKLQFAAKQFFYPFWRDHTVLEEFRIPSSLLRIDLLNLTKKIVVEIHGRQHTDYVKHFHGNREGYRAAWLKDIEKEDWISKAGFKFVEVFEKDVPLLSRKFFMDKYDIDII